MLGAAGPLTFVPHLIPLDQGELVSCYVRPSRELAADELHELFAARYGEEPFVELVDGPPGVRDVRETNFCRIHATIDRHGRPVVFAAIDNLWKGAAGQAIQNLNLMLGLDETEGTPVNAAATATFSGPAGSSLRRESRSSTPPSSRRDSERAARPAG